MTEALEDELISAEEAARAANYRLSRARAAIMDAHRRCAVCGATDEDSKGTGYGPLIDIKVVVASGEEGNAEPQRYFCEEHAEPVLKGLVALGFGVHRHGGINFLEPVDCAGFHDMDSCPTPVRADADGNEWD